jgi:hypothetical protein
MNGSGPAEEAAACSAASNARAMADLAADVRHLPKKTAYRRRMR